TAKEMCQFGIGTLRNVAVRRQERSRVLEIELLVRPQKFLELFIAALESRRCNDGGHLSSNSFYLRQTDFVDFLRRFICGRMPLDVIAIQHRAIGQSSSAHGFTATREIARNEKVVQL